MAASNTALLLAGRWRRGALASVAAFLEQDKAAVPALLTLLLDLAKISNFGSTVTQRMRARGRGDADEKARRRRLRRRAATRLIRRRE
uniref:Uncharacterized protein n=1 Tax=Triticum urartu TaxID=4572 RepID=A0A8R7TFR1_TRIUA